MSGIEPHEPQDDDSIFSYKNVSTGNFDPPAYIVAFVFFFVLGYKNFGGFEKVWWHTYFRYNNILFLIRDYKFGTWSLEAKTDIEAAEDLVPELKGKIRSAARHADKILKTEFKAEIEKGQFYINNGYGKLRSTYEFYLEETKAAVVALDEFVAQEEKRGRFYFLDSINRTVPFILFKKLKPVHYLGRGTDTFLELGNSIKMKRP